MTLEYWIDKGITKLVGGITATQTTIQTDTADVALFPTTKVPFIVIIDSEQLLVTDVGTGTDGLWTVGRGYDGVTDTVSGTGSTHSDQATVKAAIFAFQLEHMNNQRMRLVAGGWNSGHAYKQNDVTGWQGGFWIALQDGTNQQPDTSPTYWEEIAAKGDAGAAGPRSLSFIGDWDNTHTYAQYEAVRRNNSLYVSLTAGNLNHDPATDTTNWAIIALLGPSGTLDVVALTKSGAQTLPFAVFTSATFDTELIDTNGLHSTVTNPSRITFQRAGTYHVSGQLQTNVYANSAQTLALILLNGTTILARQVDDGAAAVDHWINLSVDVVAAAGDYVELQAYQDSGTARSIDGARFSAHRVDGQAVNPMTSPGDVITGGTGGLATRVAAGAATDVLHGGAAANFGPLVNADIPSGIAASKISGSLTGASMPFGNLSGVPATLAFLDANGQVWTGKPNIFGATVGATAQYGTVSIGGGAWDGTTAGYFNGNANGTLLAVNALSGFNGSLIDVAVAGVRKYVVTADGSNQTVGQNNIFSGSPVATNAYGLVSIGDAPFTGAGAGQFAGVAGGTALAVNIASTSGADLVHLQHGGVSRFQVQNLGSIVQGVAGTPSAPTVALAVAGAGVDLGAHSYAISFVSGTRETSISGASAITVTTGNQQVNITNITIGPTGVTGRNIWRTVAGGAVYYLVATISDNSTTTYSDTMTDATLITQTPNVNTNTLRGGLTTGIVTILNTGAQQSMGITNDAGAGIVIAQTGNLKASTAGGGIPISIQRSLGTANGFTFSGGAMFQINDLAAGGSATVAPYSSSDLLRLQVAGSNRLQLSNSGAIISATWAVPSAPTGLADAGVGNVDSGAHSWAVVYSVTGVADTNVSATTVYNTTTGDGGAGNARQVSMAIPYGPNGTSARKIYRSKVGTVTPLYFVATVNDNTTLTFTDNVADATLVTPIYAANYLRGSINTGSVTASTQSIAAGNFNSVQGSALTLTQGGQLTASTGTTVLTLTRSVPTGGFGFTHTGQALLINDIAAATGLSTGSIFATQVNGANRFSVAASGDITSSVWSVPAAAAAALAAGGSIDTGNHDYRISFLRTLSETTQGAAVTINVTGGGSSTVNLTAIPLGPTGTTGRNIWRSKAGTTTPLFLVATIGDNTTTTYTDAATDASLSATSPRTINTTAGSLTIGSIVFRYNNATDGGATLDLTSGTAMTTAGNALSISAISGLTGKLTVFSVAGVTKASIAADGSYLSTTATATALTAAPAASSTAGLLTLGSITPSGLNASGTVLVLSEAKAFAGDLLHLMINTGSRFKIDNIGNVTMPALNIPGAPTVALAGAVGNVDNGAHTYMITYVTASGETTAGTSSAAVTVVDKTVNGQVTVSAIPTGPNGVTARKVYRSKAGTTTPFFLQSTINDNTTTSVTDNTADASLTTSPPAFNLAIGKLNIGSFNIAGSSAGSGGILTNGTFQANGFYTSGGGTSFFAQSDPSASVQGTLFRAGSTFSASFAGSASGTFIGFSAASGYVGNWFDFQLAGVSKALMTYDGLLKATNNTASHFGGIATVVKAGTPADSDWATAPPDGTMAGDSTATKLWVRLGGTWRFVTLT